MNHQKHSTQLSEIEEYRYPDIEFDASLKVEFDDDCDVEYVMDFNLEADSELDS